MDTSTGWFYWAVLSAVFAALTAIFAKVGIQDVNSDLATLVRTAIIIVVLSVFVWFTGKWSNPFALPYLPRRGYFSDYLAWLPLLPGCATSEPFNSAMHRRLHPWTN